MIKGFLVPPSQGGDEGEVFHRLFTMPYWLWTRNRLNKIKILYGTLIFTTNDTAEVVKMGSIPVFCNSSFTAQDRLRRRVELLSEMRNFSYSAELFYLQKIGNAPLKCPEGRKNIARGEAPGSEGNIGSTPKG